jgi:polysaccharide pyruvyl transferase WcaK-like protein
MMPIQQRGLEGQNGALMVDPRPQRPAAGRGVMAIEMGKNLKRPDERGRKIYLFGHFGSGNFGNDITLQTVLDNICQRLPGAEFICICTSPAALAASQKIKTVPISREFGGPRKRRTGLAGLPRKIFIGIPRELFRWFEAFKTLKGADMLIVPGTGLLTDAYGVQGWGPYNVFKWSFVAKLRGCRVLFLSVGAGPLYSALGKFFVKSALSMADFRSYRDDASMNWLKAIGFRTNNDHVYPDLAFSLPETAMRHVENRQRRRRVVGLGLMVYAGKYSVAEPRDTIYRQYLENLAIFAQWLLDHDYDIRLLVGETNDRFVLEEFKALLQTTAGEYDKARVIDEPVHSVEQLLPQIAATDFVVATRFHNVLLSLLFNKPVIAISFHHKCSSLMSEMGLSEYTHDINDMNVNRLIGQFQDVEKKAEQLKPFIREKVIQWRKALDEQYNLVFNSR